MEYSSAIKTIRDSGKILNLTLARQKDAVSQEKLAEFILNDLIWCRHISYVNKNSILLIIYACQIVTVELSSACQMSQKSCLYLRATRLK